MDLRDYTKSLILKVFKKNNFILDQSKSLKANDMSFVYNDFKVNLSTNKNEPCIFITVKYHNVVAKHQLFVALDLQRQEYKKDSECISSNVMTIWNLYDFNSNIPNFKNRTSEVDMLEYWIMDKFKEINASKNLYEKYCPICKGKNVDNNDNVYICSDCNSIYTFKNNSNKNIIWFLTYRR